MNDNITILDFTKEENIEWEKLAASTVPTEPNTNKIVYKQGKTNNNINIGTMRDPEFRYNATNMDSLYSINMDKIGFKWN